MSDRKGCQNLDSSPHLSIGRATETPPRPPGFGARFVRLSDEERGLITEYVQQREPMRVDA